MTTFARPQPPVARVLGALVALAALVATMVLTAAPADAHARLEGSSPQDGATLAAVPPEVMLQFNEPIKEGLNQVTVKSGSTDVATGDPQVDGSKVYQPIDYTMDPGEYTVTYKVVSADGHPVSGSFSFTYAPPEQEGGAEDDPEATPFSPSESSTPAEEPSETSSEDSGEQTGEPPAEDTSTSPSETSSPSDESPTAAGEETTDETPQDEQDAQGGQESTSPWWWALAAGALALVIGGLVILVRPRRGTDDEDDIPME